MFKHVVEIGCDGKSSLHSHFEHAERVEIFECNPTALFEISKLYGEDPKVKVYPYALWKEKGTIPFVLEGASSYVAGLNSPCLVNDGIFPTEEKTIQVEARTFDEFDDGTIDIMDIDIEGAEWYVIERMTSRPRIMMIELKSMQYVNPHYSQIMGWLTENYYYQFEQHGACFFFQRLI